MAVEKHDKQYVLQKRLGADPDTQARIKRGWDAVGGDDMSGSAGRIFKGVAAQKWGRSSIIGMAKENVFEFPVFMSDSIPLEEATAINSLLEQVYASYLQMALSIDPVVSSDELRRRGGQFSKFKTNISKYVECVDLSYQKDAAHNVVNTEYGFMEFSMAAIDDSDAKVILEALDYVPLSEFDHYFQEAVKAGSSSGYISGQTNDEKRTTERRYDANGNPNGHTRSIQRTTHQDISVPSRNDLTNLDDDEIANMNDASQRESLEKLRRDYEKAGEEINKIRADLRALSRDEAASDAFRKRMDRSVELGNAAEKAKEKYDKMLEQHEKREKIYSGKELAEARKKYEDAQAAFDSHLDHIMDASRPEERTAEFIQLSAKTKKSLQDFRKAELEVKKIQLDMERAIAQDTRDAEKHLHDTKLKAPQMMDETKINKLNTMKPLMMVVNMSIMSKDGNVSRPIEYMVGVKTHCRLIKAETLPEVVKYPVKEMDEISRKAKWRAGELKFFKDIVFDIKGKKQTAMDSRDPNRKWYRRLFELAHQKGDNNVAKMVTGKKSADGLIPNVTMVISKGDVDNIEEVTGIDMLKPSNAVGFCSQLFMMGIIVVDIDAQSIKLLFPDINNDYEVQSLAAVNRQVAQLSTAGQKTQDIFKTLMR